MGIRSLLRNAFGRSKATRDGSGAARNNADQPESATIPEAREESTPAPATPTTTAPPEAEVPAARTAPGETSGPAPAPATASLPAQSGPVERAPEPPTKAEPTRDEAPVRDEATAEKATTDATDETVAAVEATEPARPKETDAAADAGTVKVVEQRAATHENTREAEQTAEEAAPTAAAAGTDSAADLVSQAFDGPAPSTAPTTTADTPAAEADEQPTPVEKAEKTEKAEAAEPSEKAEKAEADAEAAAQPAADADTAAGEATEQAAGASTAEVTKAPEKAPQAAPKATVEADAEATAANEPAVEAEATPEATTPPVDEPAPAESVAAAPAPAAVSTETAADDSVHTVAPDLLPLYEAARATLEKHELTTQRATVYLVLDRSGSMRSYYKDGTVQHLAEQALGLSAHLDDEATVPVVFFSTDVDGSADLDLTNYAGRIEELHSGLGHMGRTNYHWAIEAVVAHYKKSGSSHPAFVIFQTDGAPTSKPAAERALCEAAGLPIFWQFIGFGDPEAKGFDFLRKLDDLTVPEKRAVDNAGFFHAGRDPRSLSHDALYQQLMVEFPEWLTEARAAKVLKDS
ncbi:VWA domain-containing protein [Streptomyces albulus]|uniref:VWA domain-containing protein n=1 Tax=Streptomyces noursei TaxID=1971 RepID=UPI001F3F7D72|nr:VWA domain-containing protein [Streptomyces noursei]MCE4943247.1 VWA domain-containing protein [Streptomyces noursei]